MFNKSRFLLVILNCYFLMNSAWALVTWNANQFYRMGSVVVESGVAYIALSNNVNKPPAMSTQFWIKRSDFNSNIQTLTTQPVQPITGYSQQLNMGAGGIVNQNSTSQQIEGWDTKSVYTKGRVVSYDGAIWRASYWSQGETPGTSEAWSPTTTSKWSPNVAYEKGKSAIYNGITYTAKWWTKGDIPLSDKTGVWKVGQGNATDLNPVNQKSTPTNSANNYTNTLNPTTDSANSNQYTIITQKIDISSQNAWRSDTSYKINAVVGYDGAAWRKISDLDTRKSPPEEGLWTPLSLTKWYPQVVYSKGMTVLVEGDIWFAQWFNKGIDPKTDSTGVWIRVDENGNRISTSEKANYVNTHVYVKGDKCMYGNISWIASYWNQNEPPGTTQAWVPLGLTQWYAAVAYDPRETDSYRSQAIYKGVTWQAQWWTMGETPSLSAAWKPLSVTNWISFLAYAANDEVIYDGSRWRAQWWTQSEEPNKSDVWLPLTTSNWYSTRAYIGGQVVKYENSNWTAQWWTKGDIPGQSGVWRKN